MSRRNSKFARVPNGFVRAATQVSQVIHRHDIQGSPDDEYTQVNTSAARPPADPFGPEPTVSRAMALLDDIPNSWPSSPATQAAQQPQPVARVEYRQAPIATPPRAEVPRTRPPTAPPQPRLEPVPAPATPRRPAIGTAPPTPPAAPVAHQAAPAPAPLAMPAHRGRVVALFGCRGGCGATTLAVNVGAELARVGKRVCIVDLDLQLGDVFVALDLEPSTSIAGLARQIRDSDEPWDEASLRRRLVRHDSGVHAITQAGRLDDIDAELAENLPALLELLAEHFDYVLVDGVRDFGDFSLSVLDAADDVALVVTQDVASVRRANRVISLFRTLGYDGDRLRLVLNRFNRRASIDVAEVERALGLAVHARICNDYKRVRRAFDDGAIVGDVANASRVADDLRKLTSSFRDDTAVSDKPQRRWLPWRKGAN